MTNLDATHDEWRALYQAAVRLKEIAPWGWMEETDVFGVQNPETGELGFVSIMGTLGEHLAVAVYPGPKALYSFWSYVESAPEVDPERLLEIPQLQASFENRNELTKKDLDLIKELGLKFRGRQAWPLFRSYRPGYWPWYLEAPEVRFLTYALEQAAEVTPRVKEDPSFLEPAGDESYLVRAPREGAGGLVWEDHIETVPPVEAESIAISMDMNTLAKLKQSARRRATLEVDFFMMPVRVGERGERPALPYMLLSVDAQSGMVLGTDLLNAEEGLEDMWGMAPVTLLYQLVQTGGAPTQINVRSTLLIQLLQPLAEELGFRVQPTARLPALDQARDFLLQRFT